MSRNYAWYGAWSGLLSVSGVAALGEGQVAVGGIVVLLVLVWGITALQVTHTRLARVLASPLNGLRRLVALYGLVLLAYVLGGALLWLGAFNPPIRDFDFTALFFLTVYLWGFMTLLTFDLDSERRHVLAAGFKTSRFTGLLISLASVGVVILALEIGMRALMDDSDNFARTLPHQRWEELYWHPINALGYRDYELDSSANPAVKKVLVLGDSFVAGHGIQSIDDTFPHLLAQQLGAGYSVHIAAQPGWSTHEEVTALAQYPVAPDIVILSYYLNDIEYAATQHGVYPQWPPSIVDTPLGWLVDHFYLANYLYWHLYVFRLDGFPERYTSYILSAYSDPGIWQTEQADLNAVIDWTTTHHARLIVLLWPVLTNVEWSSQVTQPVKDYLQAKGVTLVDMGPLVADKPPASLTVNSSDAHPNAAIHALAAQQLYAVLRAG